MTTEQLAAIRARCEAATPGPWVIGWSPRYEYTIRLQGDYAIAQVFEQGGTYPANSNAEFIAHARADIPALLDEIARLRAEHDRYIAGTVNWDSGAVTWTSAPPFVHSPGYEAEG